MSAVDVGTQFITFSFQEQLTSPNFNLGFKNIIKPGFYSPLSSNLCTLISATKFQLNIFSAWIDATNSGAVSISTSFPINVPTDITGLTIDSAYPVFYMTYTHSITYNSYADFGFCATINDLPTNALCICTLLFSGSNIIGFDYTDTTVGAVTPSGSNLNGYYAGNDSGDIPISNGTINTNLNAQYLNGAELDTDDTLAANSDAKVCSQKAIKAYILTQVSSAFMPVGSSIDFSGINIPAGWMIEDGSSLLRADYPDLWDVLSSTISGVFTTTLSTNTVFNKISHPFQAGDCVSIISTTGSMPTGITVETKYYVNYLTANTFKLSTTYAGATATVPTDLVGSDAGSGDFTFRWNPWGIADATHFYLPDTQGISTEGSGQLTTNGASWGGANYSGRLGQYKQDVLQGFRLKSNGYTATTGSDGGVPAVGYGGNPTGVTAFAYEIVTDGTHGTPRSDYKTAGPRVGKYKIIKVI